MTHLIHSRRKQKIGTFLLLGTLAYATSAMAGNNGAVTAMATTTAQATAFVGYASGAVALCQPSHGCRRYQGTPNSPVTAIDTSRSDNEVRAFIGYQNGDTYFCELGQCRAMKAPD